MVILLTKFYLDTFSRCYKRGSDKKNLITNEIVFSDQNNKSNIFPSKN